MLNMTRREFISAMGGAAAWKWVGGTEDIRKIPEWHPAAGWTVSYLSRARREG
jgi:hypothetical protein